jgi:hypothetical protein
MDSNELFPRKKLKDKKMNIKLLTLTAVSASAVLFSACSGSASISTNALKNANTNTAVVVNNNAVTTTNSNTANTNAANTSATSNSTAAAPATDGSTIKIEEAGIQFNVPKGFKMSKEGGETVVSTDDSAVETRFSVPAGDDYEAAVKDAAKELDSYLDDVKMSGEPSKGTVDGMTLTSLKGTGKDSDGKAVHFALQILDSPKKPVLINTYAEEAGLEKYSKELDGFYKSIKKM